MYFMLHLQGVLQLMLTYILSGIILSIALLYPKWYKSIYLTEFHNIEHLI